MPELPEVEVTRRSFADRIAGAAIGQVRLGKPLRWPLGCAPDDLVGRTVVQVRRRGKYLLLDLNQGLLLVHLGMSGSILFESALPAAGSALGDSPPKRDGLLQTPAPLQAVCDALLPASGFPLAPWLVARRSLRQ